jgi:uncharacterized phage-associated protein
MTSSKKLYRTDYKKAIEAIVWLATKEPGIDIYHIAKILYYAEKTHLNRYGRPIIGATYIRMQYGQVPSEVRDLITKNEWMIEPDDLEKFSAAIEVKKEPYAKLVPLRDASMGCFSATDMECLEEAFTIYANMPFDELKEICHGERTWLETEQNQPIDYALMVDDNNENKDEIIEDINISSQYVRFC